MKQVGKKYIRQHLLRQTSGLVSSRERTDVLNGQSELHHVISDTQNTPFDMYQFVLSDQDPAKKVNPTLAFAVTTTHSETLY